MTHASRNTMTGLDFENAARINCPSNAIDLTKNKLYSYLNEFIISKWDASNVYWYELYVYKNKF